jgi:putative glutamine amidotransferase
MDQRPIIGIPTQTLQSIDGVPQDLPLSWVMNHRYYVAVASVGGAPFMIPLLEDEEALRALFDTLDGLFLAGGVDLDPPSYGEERAEWCGRTDPPRDRVELLLTRWALEEGKPILGVCRGMQVINVATGGTLLQDCTQQLPGSIKHDYFPNAGFARDYLAHEIEVAGESRLRGILGSDRVPVNSMHHQGICRLGEGLVTTAFAPDGLAEALEMADERFVVGVQWHPEMLVDTDTPTRRLFEAFIDAASEFGRSRRMGVPS